MQKLGKSLSFYLKHFHDMEAIYGDEKHELLNDFKDKDEIISLAKRVGDEAHKQASDYLEDISPKIMSLLKLKCNVKRATQKFSAKYYWTLNYWIWPKKTSFERYKKWKLSVQIYDYLSTPSVFIYFTTSSKDRIEIVKKVINHKYGVNRFKKNDVSELLIDILPINKKFDKSHLSKSILETIGGLYKNDFKQIFGRYKK